MKPLTVLKIKLGFWLAVLGVSSLAIGYGLTRLYDLLLTLIGGGLS